MYDADTSSRGGLKRQMVFYIVFQAAIFITMAVEITVFIRGEHVSGALRKIASTYAVPDSVVLAPVDLILVKVAIIDCGEFDIPIVQRLCNRSLLSQSR